MMQRLGLAFGVLLLALAAGFIFQVPLITALWPWTDGRLSYIFIGAIIAAIAAGLLWIASANEWGAVVAGALNVVVTASGMAVFLFQLSAQNKSPAVVMTAVAATVTAIFSVGLFFWSRRYPIRDPRPIPLLVRISFGVFITALLISGTTLLLRLPNIMPWTLTADSSVMFGWIFVGDAFYFLYALAYPRWHNARAQLWSFLAYDVVLLPPLLALTATVPPEHVASLIIYLIVLIYSGTVAFYYLLVNPTTRITLHD
ncbi:MAG: hypothetical protein HZC38_19890 [Chloroflexi bacterium]|nr:hypothetical protein [Chloroflexota bacterium]